MNLQEVIADAQAQQRSFFNLVVGFMALGLVVGIAALGVISARAVVERRHEIGVMRAIGYSRGMVQLNFLAESSFIALLGIAVGLGLGLLTSVNVAVDIQTDEPTFALAIPWGQVSDHLRGSIFVLTAHHVSAIAPSSRYRPCSSPAVRVEESARTTNQPQWAPMGCAGYSAEVETSRRRRVTAYMRLMVGNTANTNGSSQSPFNVP